MSDFPYKTIIDRTITDENGNVLFSETSPAYVNVVNGESNDNSDIVGALDDINTLISATNTRLTELISLQEQMVTLLEGLQPEPEPEPEPET